MEDVTDQARGKIISEEGLDANGLSLFGWLLERSWSEISCRWETWAWTSSLPGGGKKRTLLLLQRQY